MGSRWLDSGSLRGRGGSVDLTQNFLNIDRLIDVLVTTQKQNGEVSSFEERKYDDEDDVVKKPKKEKGSDCDGKCNHCTKDNNTTDGVKTNPFIGLLQGDDYYDDDDEDDFYLCEYCPSLGYRQRYDASRCDKCNICETCEEYDTGECSGCSYSVYRDGTYYRDRVDSDELFDSSDNKILKELENDDISSERLDSSRFSLLD